MIIILIIICIVEKPPSGATDGIERLALEMFAGWYRLISMDITVHMTVLD